MSKVASILKKKVPPNLQKKKITNFMETKTQATPTCQKINKRHIMKNFKDWISNNQELGKLS